MVKLGKQVQNCCWKFP